MAGLVERISIARLSGGDQEAPLSVRAWAGRGLEGDRHLLPEAEMNSLGNLTLIERASFDHLREVGIVLNEDELRRNLVVSGMELNPLVGSEFTVGDVRCLATELCEPCRYIEKRTRQGVLKALVGRGGLRARILTDGVISVGDCVNVADRPGED